jgi:hypothetical protein
MTSYAKPAFGCLLLVLGLLAGGCAVQSAKDSSIGWDRPADWENQIPGMESNAFTH